MSENSSQLDLSQLAVDRTPSTPPPTVKVKRQWLTRYVLPLGMLTGFVGLFGWSVREGFLPAQSVTVTPVVVSRAEIQQAGTPLFQAAGWVEPRPTPTVASSLAPGVIQELLVVEGQHVERGQPVATLVDTDARLALAESQTRLAMQQAELTRAEAALAAARTNLARPVRLQAVLADAEALVAQTERELDKLPYDIKAAETRKQLAAENVRRKESAGGAIAGRLLREARAELATATNLVEELSAREPNLRRQLQSLERKRTALAERLELLTDEQQAVADAEATLAVVKSRLEQARLAVEQAELRLERMTVRSPIDGCVLSLEAQPGEWLSAAGSAPNRGSSAVVGLYDPQKLQVRVDVRLEDVPQVVIGQPVQIETAALSEPIAGEVISVTTQADIQKNTLQVKVAVADPPAVIKPEMLAKVTFLAPPSPTTPSDEEESPWRLFVPETLVMAGEGGASVWVADLTEGVARRKPVEVGGSTSGEALVEVIRGLVPTDKLIVAGRESLADGARVRVTGEDRTLSADLPNGPVAATRTAQATDTNR